MKITIGHLYPDLLNLYGDRGNIQCLMKRCLWRGIEAETIAFELDDKIDFSKLDIVLLGGGSDREQMLVCEKLKEIQKDFKAYVEDNGVVIAICGGYQLLGNYYKTDQGMIEGLKLVDMSTEQGKGRLIGNIVMQSELFDMPIVGFENHGGRTTIGNNKPLGKVLSGYGNDGQSGAEGVAWPDGYIVRELSRIPSNFRCEDTIQNFLEENDIPGICGIDTRALTKLLREKGTMNGMITTKEYSDLSEPISRMKAYTVAGVVMATTTKEKYVLPGNGKKVALMDFGAKKNIARSLNERGCEVTVYPADTPAEEVLAANPDGIMLSNGPGDPKENVEIIKEIKKMYDSNVPIFAICLGHQLMALANGMDTYKLKYGHRGGNHPVKDLETGRVYISSQNHGYAVDTNTVKPEIAVPAFVNVNDGTNEGLKYTGKNIFTVQYHPEACPGPQDSGYLFDRFLKMMEVND